MTSFCAGALNRPLRVRSIANARQPCGAACARHGGCGGCGGGRRLLGPGRELGRCVPPELRVRLHQLIQLYKHTWAGILSLTFRVVAGPRAAQLHGETYSVPQTLTLTADGKAKFVAKGHPVRLPGPMRWVVNRAGTFPVETRLGGSTLRAANRQLEPCSSHSPSNKGQSSDTWWSKTAGTSPVDAVARETTVERQSIRVLCDEALSVARARARARAR